MKHFFFVWAFFSLLLCGTTSFATNSHLEIPDDSGRTPVIIRMKNQFDTKSFTKRNLAGYSGPVKRVKLIGTLKSFNSQSQESILKSLKQSEVEQEISNIRTFWITNIIACEATGQAIEKIKAREDVESVIIDQKQKLVEIDPVQEIATSGNENVAYNIEMVRALEANAYGYTGKGIVVGLIDTGVNPEHEDLKDAMWTTDEFPNHGWNFISNNNNPKDDQGHGTHCAGTILGNGTAGMRTGVAPEAKLMALKALDRSGGGTASGVIKSIEFAAEHGANVISMSLGFLNQNNSEKKLWRDTMTNLLEANILAVVAAGNEGEYTSVYRIPNNIRYPGACPPAWLHPGQTQEGGTSSVLTVGAVTKEGSARLGLSSMGPVTWQNIDTYDDYPYNPGMGLIRPDIMAPGQAVPSADYKDPQGYLPMNGTSMATPCVAGIAAAILSKNPALTPADIVRIISESSIKLSPDFNNKTGAGRADALLATLYAPNPQMNCKSIAINETAGYKNGHLNPGDEAELSFTFDNTHDEDITDYQLEVKCLSAQANLTSNEIQLPAIKANHETVVTAPCRIKVFPQASTGDLVDIAVIVKKGEMTWSNLFRLPVSSAQLSTDSLQVKELEGNGNGIADAGETVELIFPILNTGTEPSIKVQVDYETNSPYLKFPETTPPYFEEISDRENIILKCSIDPETPQWYAPELSLKLKGENIDTTFIYKIPIGKRGILMIDKSKNKLSSKAVANYLENKNFYFSQADKLNLNLEELQKNHSIWIFAGVYPNAVSLTASESKALSAYVENGGFLYMEGGDLWYDNKATTVNKFFNIDPVNYSGGKLNKILGCKPGYNEGYEKVYTYSNISVDQIEPIEPAFALYKNEDPEYTTTVAHDAGTYRTIGSSFELGGILTEKEDSPILNSYLDFFRMIKNGYFDTAIGTTTQQSGLNVHCFKSEKEYLVEISAPGETSAVVSLYNSNGQLIHQLKTEISGQSVVRIPDNRYKGIYFIKVDADGKTCAKKISF